TSNPALALLSLQEYQVVQRVTREAGRLPIRGRVTPAFEVVEVRVAGTAFDGKTMDGGWKRLESTAVPPAFGSEVSVPAGGWYRVEVQALAGGQPVASASVEHVGVGEVFVIAGQSNSTNYGEVKQSPATGMVATFSGLDWRLADD